VVVERGDIDHGGSRIPRARKTTEGGDLFSEGVRAKTGKVGWARLRRGCGEREKEREREREGAGPG
jgi:hypothetical protein